MQGQNQQSNSSASDATIRVAIALQDLHTALRADLKKLPGYLEATFIQLSDEIVSRERKRLLAHIQAQQLQLQVWSALLVVVHL